jgi:hypothetical protein
LTDKLRMRTGRDAPSPAKAAVRKTFDRGLDRDSFPGTLNGTFKSFEARVRMRQTLENMVNYDPLWS